MATYYVNATGGDNGKDGLSEANAWQTLAKVNASSFLAGDSILLKRGETWNESLVPPSSGTDGNPITFGAYGVGAKPIIDSQNTRLTGVDCTDRDHITIQDLTATRATQSNVRFNNGAYTVNRVDATDSGDQNFQSQGNAVVVYNDCTSSGAVDDGFSVHDTANVTINRCTISGNTQGFNTATGAAVVVINDSTFSGNTANDVIPDGTTTCTVNRCKFEITAAGVKSVVANDGGDITFNYCIWDVSAAPNATDTQISGANADSTITFNNCVLYGLDGIDTHGGMTVSAPASVVINLYNCILRGWWRCAYIDLGATVNADHCCFSSVTIVNLTTNISPVNSDPLFVDEANGDFHLQAGSPCRNAGTDVGLTRDYYYGTVPKEGTVDIGAAEYGTEPQAPIFLHQLRQQGIA